MRNTLQIQLSTLENDYANVRARYEEEAEAAAQARAQLSKLASEMQALKAKYDREVVLKAEEIEETRRKFALRITELEEAAERKSSAYASLLHPVCNVALCVQARDNARRTWIN